MSFTSFFENTINRFVEIKYHVQDSVFNVLQYVENLQNLPNDRFKSGSLSPDTNSKEELILTIDGNIGRMVREGWLG